MDPRVPWSSEAPIELVVTHFGEPLTVQRLSMGVAIVNPSVVTLNEVKSLGKLREGSGVKISHSRFFIPRALSYFSSILVSSSSNAVSSR
jgi:hypothetical protein